MFRGYDRLGSDQERKHAERRAWGAEFQGALIEPAGYAKLKSGLHRGARVSAYALARQPSR